MKASDRRGGIAAPLRSRGGVGAGALLVRWTDQRAHRRHARRLRPFTAQSRPDCLVSGLVTGLPLGPASSNASAQPETGARGEKVALTALIIGHRPFNGGPECGRVLRALDVGEFVNKDVVDEARW